jgi:polynucleotide 5'-hydroxyl-kinase GRC3/NOL9
MTIDPGWARALERAAQSRLTLVLGAVDTGKTSLVTHLANGLLARGARTAVVDADLGQSEIGPPTAVGLGRVTRALGRLGDAEVVALSFVGSTSPAGHVAATVWGAHRLVQRAAGFDRVLVDTSGLIGGELGRALKREKIGRLDPDLVICLERAGECEPIVREWSARGRPEILRLPAGASARRRSAEERRRHRESALRAYFRGAAPLRLGLPPLWIRSTSDRAEAPALEDREALEGALVGLDDADGDTLGLAAVRAIDLTDRALLVDTPVPGSRVAGLRLGHPTYRPAACHEVIR